MNKLIRRTLNVLAIVMLTFAMNIVVFAQGTTMIAVSKNSPAVGDKVTVSITASESGTITLKYTASMLTFVSCTGSGYTTSGNSVSFSGKTGDVVFTAAEAGTASIIVSSTSCSGSSTTLSIGGGASSAPATEEKPAESAPVDVAVEETPADSEEAAPAETPAETPTAPASGNVGTLNSQGGFDINGVSYVVSERYSDNEVPSGFSKTTVKIGSSTYSEPTNGTITLLYLKPADNVAGSGVFYLYNAEASTVSEFLMLGSGKNYVIISPTEEGPSPAFTATPLDVTGGSTTAYTIGESGFYYVYGTNGSGNTGWFVFDSACDTVSRMDESVLSAVTTVDDGSDEEVAAPANDNVDIYVNKLDTYRKVIMGLIVLCVILVFFIINALLRSRDKDDFDGDVFAEAPAKKQRKGPRSIILNRPNREEEDDYDEAEEEEEYEEDEYYDDEEYYDEEEEEYEERNDRRSSSYVESASEIDNRRNSSLNMMDLNDL
jgi:hypothetical protein